MVLSSSKVTSRAVWKYCLVECFLQQQNSKINYSQTLVHRKKTSQTFTSFCLGLKREESVRGYWPAWWLVALWSDRQDYRTLSEQWNLGMFSSHFSRVNYLCFLGYIAKGGSWCHIIDHWKPIFLHSFYQRTSIQFAFMCHQGQSSHIFRVVFFQWETNKKTSRNRGSGDFALTYFNTFVFLYLCVLVSKVEKSHLSSFSFPTKF